MTVTGSASNEKRKSSMMDPKRESRYKILESWGQTYPRRIATRHTSFDIDKLHRRDLRHWYAGQRLERPKPHLIQDFPKRTATIPCSDFSFLDAAFDTSMFFPGHMH